MARSFDDLREQLASLQAAVEEEEKRREELAQANAELAGARESGAEELARLRAAIEDMRGLQPRGADDAVLTVDAGGRRFRTYRSTLSLYGESVLATMVSPRWADHAQQEDGALFLDADPDLFQEIMYFLRRRRIDSKARSSFSCHAAELATFLGIPVDHVKGARRQVLSFGQSRFLGLPGLAFGLRLPHPAQGSVTSLTFRTEKRTNSPDDTVPQCSVFTKPGKFLGALAAREEWTLLWEGRIKHGDNRVPVDIQLKNGEEHSIYIACENAGLPLSDAAPAPQETRLECTPGRAVPRPFEWPPRGDLSHLEHADIYFAGELEFMMHAQ